MMQKLNLPDYNALFKIDQAKGSIFDLFRKKHVKLTPEEWVRQNILMFLIHEREYPKGLLSVEMALQVNNLNKRCDIVVFDKLGKAKLIVECKAPTVKIDQKTFTQIATYNLKLNVEYLLVTNGLTHYCCKMDLVTNSFQYLQEIPDYNQICL